MKNKCATNIFKITKSISLAGLLLFLVVPAYPQTIVFDDFSYTGNNDPAIQAFNRWTIIDGVSGPPEGANYLKSNVTFTADPDAPSNTFMNLKSSNTNTVSSTAHSRMESVDMNYGEGTYAARVYFDNSPRDYHDPVVQTFYTITSWSFQTDPDRYSEVDFEYLPWDAWSGDYGGTYDPAMFMTSWETGEYENKKSEVEKRDFSGWHTLVFSFVDGTTVRYYIDGVLQAEISTADNGVSVYPDNTQFVSFANWIYTIDRATLGSSPDLRSCTMKVDWFIHVEGQEKTPAEMEALVSTYRAQGIQRRNRAGEVYPEGPTGFSLKIEAEDYSVMEGVDIEPAEDEGGGLNVGWIDAGDWMVYPNITIPEPGMYQVAYRVASLNGEGLLSLDLNAGAIVLGEIGIPSTGGWQNWITIQHTVNIDAGTYNLGIWAAAGGWNLNWLTITRVGTAASQAASGARQASGMTPHKSEPLNSEAGTILFPNPVNKTVNIQTGSPVGKAELKIIDTDGRDVSATVKIRDNTIDVSALPPGPYILRIQTGTGQVVKKFIKD